MPDFIPNPETIQTWITGLGAWAWLGYLLWGTLSVIFTPLNFSAIGLAGGFAYGTVWAFLINWICKILGTSISFWLSHHFGRKLVERLIPQKQLSRFDYLVKSESTMLLYTVLCFIPFTPSDTLAYLVGMSSVKFRVFLPISILANSGTAFALAYLGSGGAFHNPLFLIVLGLGLLLGLAIIHNHRKKIGLHS